MFSTKISSGKIQSESELESILEKVNEVMIKVSFSENYMKITKKEITEAAELETLSITNGRLFGWEYQIKDFEKWNEKILYIG